jgi:hypothetical protein
MSLFYKTSCEQELVTGNLSAMFNGHICKHCNCPGTMVLSEPRKLCGKFKDEVVFTKTGPYTTALFSARVRDFFITGGLIKADFVEASDEYNQIYYELCPIDSQIPFVGIVTLLGDPVKALECPNCRMQVFLIYHKKMDPKIGRFISEFSRAKITKHVAISGYSHAPEVIFDEPFMRRLKAEKIKKLSFSKVGVLPDDEVEFPLTCCTPYPAKAK